MDRQVFDSESRTVFGQRRRGGPFAVRRAGPDFGSPMGARMFAALDLAAAERPADRSTAGWTSCRCLPRRRRAARNARRRRSASVGRSGTARSREIARRPGHSRWEVNQLKIALSASRRRKDQYCHGAVRGGAVMKEMAASPESLHGIIRKDRISTSGNLSRLRRTRSSKGGVIATGVNAELDELRNIATQRQRTAAPECNNGRAKHTGIPSLKIGFNNVFGYYIEVTQQPTRTRHRPTGSASRR